MYKKSMTSGVLVLMALFVGVVDANLVSNHSALTNDRFNNDPSFIADGYDLSGIGRTIDGNWATRIGDNYFLSSSHYHPHTGTATSLGENVTFYTSNDPSGPSYTYPVAGGYQIAGTDVWLGYFNETLDSSIKTYNYSTTNATSLETSGIAGEDVLMFGNSVTANSAYGGAGALTDMVVAQNQAESWLEEGTTAVLTAGIINTFATPIGWDQIVMFRNESIDTAYDFQTYEGLPTNGDSGSPLMSVAGGELILQGLTYGIVVAEGGLIGNFVDTGGPLSATDTLERRLTSFYSYVGSQDENINAAIALVPTPTPVPEPNTSLLVLMGIGGLLVRRRI